MSERDGKMPPGSGGENCLRLRLLGAALVLVGLLMPAFFTMEGMEIYDTLLTGLYQEQEVYILLAGLKLVALNAVRAYPHYMGVFFLIESFRGMGRRRRLVMTAAAVFVLIPGVYVLIDWIYHIRYDFGIPAMSMLAMVLVLGKIDFSFVELGKKILMVAFLITALQFLDLMPILHSFPFGRGEISYDIKMVSLFLGADGFLQGAATLFFALFLFMAVLLMMLIVEENNIRRISEQKEQNERMLTEARIRNLESRTDMELRNLVHDLKSPLTGIQTLVGVVKLSCQSRGDAENVQYLDRVEEMIDHMSSMISEILHDEQRSAVTTQEFLSSVMAQLSAAEYAELIQTENRIPGWKIYVNKIRFARVVANLVENAAHAVPRTGGEIRIRVEGATGESGPQVRFVVRDNGVGIPRELMDEIWKKGFSSRNSSGLGLNFVEQVVEQCGGTVHLESVEHEGTVATVSLPRYQEDDDETKSMLSE